MNSGVAGAAVDPAGRRRPGEFLSCCRRRRLQKRHFLIFHLLIRVATSKDWGEEELEGLGARCREL